MKQKLIITLAVVCYLISFSIVSYGAENPAGKSGKPGFDNGKAWWKNTECIEVVDSLESENDELYSQIEALQAEIKMLKEQNNLLLVNAEVQKPDNSTANKFQVRQTSEDHPNAPNMTGINIGMLVQDSETISQLISISSGYYDVTIKVITPDGDEIFINTNLYAAEAPLQYSSYFLNLVK